MAIRHLLVSRFITENKLLIIIKKNKYTTVPKRWFSVMQGTGFHASFMTRQKTMYATWYSKSKQQTPGLVVNLIVKFWRQGDAACLFGKSLMHAAHPTCPLLSLSFLIALSHAGVKTLPLSHWWVYVYSTTVHTEDRIAYILATGHSLMKGCN